MKKILIALTAIALSFSAMAQTKMNDTTAIKKTSKTAHKKSSKTMHKMKTGNGLMMMDGKMMTRQDGKNTPMTEDKTLANGTKVMPDGTVEMKDGKKVQLKEGECVMMDGKIQTMPVKKRACEEFCVSTTSAVFKVHTFRQI
jgi:hypothetical protein